VILRRLAAGLLLTATLAAATAEHHHALLGEDSSSSAPSSVISSHRGQSASSHIHAILRIVENDPCWACQWSRQAGVPRAAATSGAVSLGGPIALLPPRSAVSIARFTRSSRAPPELL